MQIPSQNPEHRYWGQGEAQTHNTKNTSLYHGRDFYTCLEVKDWSYTTFTKTHQQSQHIKWEKEPGSHEIPLNKGRFLHPHALVKLSWWAHCKAREAHLVTATEETGWDCAHTPEQAVALNIGVPSSTARAYTRKALNKGRQSSQHIC